MSDWVVSDSLQPHGLQPVRLLCPWNSLGKNTGVGCHLLLQGIFTIPGLKPHLLCLVRILHHWAPWEARNACVVLRHSVLADSVTLSTVVHQAPLFMGVLQVRLLERGAMPSSRGSSQPGHGARSPAVWADSLPSEPPGKPKNTGVGSLSLLQGIFLSQELNWGLLNCRRILYQLSYPGKPICMLRIIWVNLHILK